jgi:negative regulator of flagellin synthesis FlgM
MINGIQNPIATALRQLKPSGIIIGEPMAKAAAVEAKAAPSPAADLAAAGPPVDTGKVARIRAAIADGSYRVDPKAVAGRMVDLDLPQAQPKPLPR